MENQGVYPAMAIKVAPYQHQREAFELACRLFGLVKVGDAENCTPNTKSNGVALLCEMGTG